MKLEFSIGEMALDKSEATAILNATEGSPVIKIDISRHVDHKLIDAKKLFPDAKLEAIKPAPDWTRGDEVPF